MELLTCDNEESTFYVLRKTDATLVPRSNIDVEETL